MSCDLGKTKKKKSDKKKKEQLWGMFEQEVSGGPPPTIECVYRSTGERESCDLCQSSLLITDEGYLACTNDKCGYIYTDILDQGAEWRFYGGDDNQGQDPTRCGMPVNPLLVESSYGCKVVCQSNTSYEMRKIRRYTEWQAMPYKEKAQYDEFQRIQIMGSNAGIPKLIINDAMKYHKMVSEHRTFRGLNRDGIIAASIYIASRTNDNPRTAREIATIFSLDNTSTTKGCKNAMTILNEIEHDKTNNDKTHFNNTTPTKFIERYCSKLQINQELTKVCKFAASQIEKKRLIPENTPQSVAAGIIYFIATACNLNVSKKEVWQITGTSEVTIGKCHTKLLSMQSQLIPGKILEKYKTS